MDFIDILTVFFRATNGIRVAFNPIFTPTRPIVSTLLTELKVHVDETYIATYCEHVAKVNYSQLQSANRLVVLFQWRFPGWYSWKRDHYFEPTEGTKKLLNFKIVFEDGRELHGNLVSIDGVLCNITFSEDLSFFRKVKISKVIAKSGSIKKREKAQA